MIDATKGTD